MPTYMVTDSQTGRKFKLTGDSPPTEQELLAIFAQHKAPAPALGAPPPELSAGPTFNDPTPKIESPVASSTGVNVIPQMPPPETEEERQLRMGKEFSAAGARGGVEAIVNPPPESVTSEMQPGDLPLPDLGKPQMGPGGEAPGTPETYDRFVESLPKEEREKIRGDARVKAYFDQYGKVGSISAGLAASIPFLNNLSDEEKAEYLNMNPELFMTGQIGGTVLQSIGLAGLVGKGLQAIPMISKSPLLSQALTRALVAGGLSGVRSAEDVVDGKATIADALWATARGAGAGLVSVIPEVFAPANAIQLLAQPLADLVYDVGVGAISGEDVGSDEWIKQELLNLAISEGFAIRDVASGVKFKATQGAQRAEIQKWLKGKGGDGFEILDKLDLPRPTPGDEQRPTETKIGEPTKSVAETKPEEEEPTFDVGTAGADATKSTGEYKTPQTPEELTKTTQKAVKNLTQSTSKSAAVDEADKATAKVLGQFKGTTEPQNVEEMLNVTKAFMREANQPGVPETVRRNQEALISLTNDNVLDMPTRPIYVNSIYRLAQAGQDFSIGAVDARNLGALNLFFQGKVPDANGKYYDQAWAEAHPEFLDADGNALKDHDAANIAFKMAVGDPLKAEFDTPASQMNRTGGDEGMGVNAGGDAVDTMGRLQRASQRSDEVVKGLGLHMLPHPKHDGLPTGFGIDVGAADHVRGTDPMATSGNADRMADAAKGVFLEDVSNRYIDKNGNKPYIKDESREGAWKENPDYVGRDETQTTRLGQADTRTTEGGEGEGQNRIPGAGEAGAGTPAKPEEPVKPPKTPPAAKKPPADGGKQKERSFPKTAEKKGRVGGEDRLYTPQSNEESIKRADAIVNERGLDGAEQWVKSPESKGAEKTAVAIRLIDHYQTRASKETGARAEASMAKAMDIASEASKALTQAGQEIQAVRVLGKITPEMYLVAAQKRIDTLNKTRGEKRKLVLKSDDAKKITGLAKDAQAWDTLDKDTKATLKSIQKVMETGEITSGDIETLKTLRARIGDTIGAVPEPKAKGKPQKPSLNKMLQSRLSDMAAERMEKFKKEATQIKLRAGLPAEEMADLSIIGAAKLTETGLKFVEWSKSMLGDFGDEIQPHLKKIYRKAQVELRTERARTRKLWEQATAIDRVLKRMEADEFVPEADLEAFKARLEEAEKLTGEARTEAILETQQAIEMLKPVGFWRKVSVIQTLAQLLNPKTIGRNLVGNALMQVAERGSKVVGTGIDIAVSKATGKREVTFKTGGVKALEEMYKGFMFGTRRAWKGLPQGDISTKYQLQAPAFKTDAEGKFKYAERTLAYMEKSLGVVLGATDRATYESAKNVMLGELGELAAINNRIPKAERTEYVQNWIKNASDDAIELSHQYGKYVTFQDDNFLSESAVALKRLLNAKQEFGAGDLVLKYPKTPSNLVNRAFAYSPAGFVKSMYHLAKAIPAFGGEFNQRDFVMSMSRALVGTAGLTGMGIALYNMGVITGDAENYNVSSFEREQTGGGPFRVNVSALTRWVTSGFADRDALKKKQNDTLVSYDWAQPLAISLSMGANAAQLGQENAIKSGDYGSLLGSMVDLFGAGAQSFAELPMLTGLQTLFGRGTPGDEGRRVMNALERVFEQAPSSFVPTFVYQIRQMMDNTAREKHDPNPLKKALNNAINKLPFVEKMLPEAYNTMGLDKKEIYKGGTNTLFNVFFNPAFVTKYDVDPMVQTILGPYESERRTGQLPKRAPRKLYYSKNIVNNAGIDQAKLKEMGVSTIKDRVVFELDAKEISTLQRFMAALTTKTLQKQLTPEKLEKLKAQTPEQQEKVLAKLMGVVSKVSRTQFLQKAAGNISGYTIPNTLGDE